MALDLEPSGRPIRRRVAQAAGLLLLATAVALAGDDPGARQRADAALRARLAVLGLERWGIAPPAARPAGVQRPASQASPPRPLNLRLIPEQVRARLGFTPVSPAYVPTGYRHADEYEILDAPLSPVAMWRAFRASQGRPCSYGLVLQQWRGPPEPPVATAGPSLKTFLPVPPPPSGTLGFPIGARPLASSLVRGSVALRVAGVPAGRCHRTTPDGKVEDDAMLVDVLAWSDRDARYRLLVDADLGWAEVERIAASVDRTG
jgi:hypothetical protein